MFNGRCAFKENRFRLDAVSNGQCLFIAICVGIVDWFMIDGCVWKGAMITLTACTPDSGKVAGLEDPSLIFLAVSQNRGSFDLVACAFIH